MSAPAASLADSQELTRQFSHLPTRTDAAKLFASMYALYSGLFAPVAVVGVMLVLILHRVPHKLNIADG